VSEGPRNLPASILDRLRNRARASGEELQWVLTRFALERLLYRLSRSPYREQFVLKGAMLFQAWTDRAHRTTRDLDLLGFGENSPERLAAVFGAICRVKVEDDGIVFDAATLEAGRIKEGERYEGVRLRLDARLASARVPVLIDIGFADAVTPEPEDLAYPVLLNLPVPWLRAYSRETVVAEKLEAMVTLGIANSRMKDFYDLWILSRTCAFDGPPLVRAIVATFERRATRVSAEPVSLTRLFAEDETKRAQWRVFVQRSRLSDGSDVQLSAVIEALRDFVLQPLVAARRGGVFAAQWPAGGPWAPATEPGSD